MTALHTAVLVMVAALVVACASPAPKSGDFQRPVPPDYLGLLVDTDLLNTSRLDSEDKSAAQELLKTYYSTEYSLRSYIDALETNVDGNERLKEEYSTAEAIVGGVAGLSSIGVIFATAAIAVPVTGVVWIGISQYTQHYNIEPQIKKTDRQLTEAQGLLRLFPDIEKLFDGLAYAETYDEAHRRFKKWAAYVKNLEARTAKFFAKASSGQPMAGSGSPSASPTAPPPTDPPAKD